jgi:hypothetical protein
MRSGSSNGPSTTALVCRQAIRRRFEAALARVWRLNVNGPDLCRRCLRSSQA